MNTIQTYLDSMFAHLDDSPEVLHLKEEIHSNMLDKYHDLIQNGASENEAVGKVISEFGNIDELLDELNIDQEQSQAITPSLPLLNQSEINNYLADKTYAGLLTGLGTFLIIASVAILISLLSLFGEESNFATIAGTSLIIISVVLAIALYIIGGKKDKKYKYIDKGEYGLSNNNRNELIKQAESFESTHSLSTIMGIALILLPVIPVVIVGMMDLSDRFILLATSALVLGIAAAVFIFIYFGNIKSMYQSLLKNTISEKSSPKDIQKHQRNRKTNRLIEDIYWPIITVIYFLWSFSRGSWHISWLIFVIAGIFEDAIRALFDIEKEQ
ncbi:hypothetical protein HZY91_06385 [Facklamia sp. DSM 111018]|uniref:Beta-carotene 15,15'-monooxygenase n=1 Tax=Facklamia lactis TaxID=2749967 RepID=A0ABS0LRD2_9LACT|nr:permease prefix domain 1-containing protein [Facklamia lactis]MBG9986522.1 hypothetical protein [Facklamia lactis]